MSAESDCVEAILIQGTAIERMSTLALEYHAKAITPERFAARIYEILHDLDVEMRGRFPRAFQENATGQIEK